MVPIDPANVLDETPAQVKCGCGCGCYCSGDDQSVTSSGDAGESRMVISDTSLAPFC
jgi:hypothetical protein